MLRITVNKSAAGAKKYYSEKYYGEGQKTQDYYSEKDQAMGTWGGKAAEKLGLVGDIKKEDFASLCDNLIPGTNDRLTCRNNIEKRVGTDFTFNTSKSVGLAFANGTEKEKRDILKSVEDSNKETMLEVEAAVQCRVRRNGANENRETANMAYGSFLHLTSRPVDGVADIHIHTHNFLFNVTHDHVEEKYKAIELGQVVKDAPYYEAIFHSHLASKLEKLGYSIERTKNGFEIKGVTREMIEKFSRRTTEIELLAKEKNITSAKGKDKLGAITRESKRSSISEAEQEKDWQSRLTESEKTILRNLRKYSNADNYSGGKSDRVGFDIIASNNIAKDAVEHALHHHLERKSVSTDKEILAMSIKSSIGQATVADIKKAFSKNDSIISVRENHQNFITTKEALAEENKLIEMAIATKGKFKALNEDYQPKVDYLDDEQKNAINRALTTTDGILIIAGKAGTGKTTLMKEVQSGIKESNKNIFAVAPSANASRGVLREEGFEKADTIEAFLRNKQLHNKIKNGVLWVDEGGMVSNRQMRDILMIAKEQNARVIITGDTKQHNSVERGDALRLLQELAGIIPVTVSKIKRQKHEQYREAVAALSKSKIDKGFAKLDKMGAIHEITDRDERINKVAEDYVSSTYGKTKKPKKVLVISPTHAEGDKVIERIRDKLRDENIIGATEKPFSTFKNLQLTEAEKTKTENYVMGNWLIFHQNIAGIKAGSRFEIAGTERDSVLIKTKSGNTLPVPVDKSANYNVFEARDISLSKGDKIRITGNGHAMDGKNLFNGSEFMITGFDRQGNIKLSNGSVISKEYGQFAHGYVMTSHSSQSKTVGKVIISQSSMSFRASSKEQIYVSVSRGVDNVSIYTDDKADLLRAISQSNERKSAIELTKQKQLSNVIEMNRMGIVQRIKKKAIDVMEKIKANNIKTQIGYGQLQRKDITKETGRNR